MKKWMPTGVGAEPKKLAILGVLAVAVVAAYKFSSASTGTPSGASPAAASGVGSRVSPAAGLVPTAPASPRRLLSRGAGSSSIADFHPTLKLDEGADVSKIDPTLRLDLLARVQQVPMEGGSRNLFEFSQPPPPPVPKVIVKPGPVGPQQPPPPAPPPVAVKNDPPPPPPIPLKFYGYAGTTREGVRRAFFLDGDDIYTPAENETVKGRYKIIHIGVNSAVVEDTTNHNQQTLPLVEELGA